ncbi:MAG: ABC transporter permease subunit [Actinomycetota bacterium]|nr:ABC transporter permease subunit [Actinomycetota bacterium]
MTQAIQTAPLGHYRMKNVVRSEVVKILTLRSTAVTLGITVAAALLVTGLVSNAALGHPAAWYVGFDPTQTSLTGLIVAGLTGGVFGALIITGEYSSGTIRSSLAATPRRSILLRAKIGVTAAAVIAFCEVLSFASFLLGQAILSGQPRPSAAALQESQGPGGPGGSILLGHLRTDASLGSPGALRAVWMTGLFIALLALMAFGLGLIFRSTAGAIAGFAGVTFVLPLVMRGISQHLDRYMPTNILVNSVMSTTNDHGGPYAPLSAPMGLLAMALYALVALAVGAILFNERDA